VPATAAMTPPVPLVLRRLPVRPVSARLVVVALVMTLLVPVTLVANRFVVVAFVDVLFVMVTPLKVDDAPLMMSPSEVVGERAPATTFQLVNDELMKSTPGIAAMTLLEPSVFKSVEVRPARLRTPAAENDEVAVPPKDAICVTESCVEDARANCWSAVQVLALFRLSDATTAPLVGEMVSVPSALVTEVTPPCPRHEPDASRKQPPVSWMPFAKVDVAEVLKTSRAATRRPLEKVEVPAAETLRLPVTARFVDVALPAVSAVVFNIEEVAFVVLRFAAKRFVVVAFVAVALVMVTPWKVDDAPRMMMPTEVVGERAPAVSSKVLPNALYPAGA